jgi:hypothetical protein
MENNNMSASNWLDDENEDDFQLSNPDAAIVLNKWKGKVKQKRGGILKNKNTNKNKSKKIKKNKQNTELGLLLPSSPISASVASSSVASTNVSSWNRAPMSQLEIDAPTDASSSVASTNVSSWNRAPMSQLEIDAPTDASSSVASTHVSSASTSASNERNSIKEFSTYREFNDAFIEHEITTISHYNIHNKSPNFDIDGTIHNFLETFSTEKDLTQRIQWKYENKADDIPIPFSGIPFTLLNKRQCRCHQGKNKDAKSNQKRMIERRESAQSTVPSEHFTGFRGRKKIQNTKKLNCPCSFVVKKLLYFPGYSVPSSASEHHKKKILKTLRHDLLNLKNSTTRQVHETAVPLVQTSDIDFNISEESVNSNAVQEEAASTSTPPSIEVELKYVVRFPTSEDHMYHHQGVAAGLIEPLDDRVREHIKTLVRNGCRRKAEIISRTQEYVNTHLFTGQCRLRRRFKPDGKTIRNIVASVKLETRYSRFDQENLREALQRGLCSDGRYKFIPKGSVPAVEDLLMRLEAAAENEDWEDFDDVNISVSSNDVKLCFVYQSNEMCRLYRKYAVHLILLDATHKVCKYTIPLFLLVVQTNVNFQVVAIIILEDESAELLLQALNIVKSWNPDICPKYGMVDFDAAEISTLESLFDGIEIFLCDFHREQAWTRWVNKRDNGVYNIADDVLRRLRRIANSNNIEEVQKAVSDLRSWEIFSTSKLEDYFNNTWYPELERWCRAYRPADLFRCNTNNGTERLNESLKYETMDCYSNFTMTELVTILAQNFLPDLYEKYVSLNIKYTAGHKGYNPTIPKFMINRPGPLVEDMLKKFNSVTAFMVRSVHPITPSSSLEFVVESFNDAANTRNMYTVKFGNTNQICSCECVSFRIDRLLCKHFFAVFQSEYPFHFEHISPLYIKHPYTTIDDDVIGGASILGETMIEDVDHQDSVALEFPEPSSVVSTSLPLRRKNRSSNSHPCFARMKVINDKLHNNPNFRDEINDELGAILDKLNLLESSSYGEGELGVRGKTGADQVVSEPDSYVIPARRYDSSIYEGLPGEGEGELSREGVLETVHETASEDQVISEPAELCIYKELPKNKGKRKHAYSGRFGETAEVMRKQLRANIPVKKSTTVSTLGSSVLIDGTGDITDSIIAHNDRDFEYEEYLLQQDVIEWVDELLDVVENCVNAPSDDSDDGFEF